MPTSEWKVFKTSGQSTPHELRSVLDQEINTYLMEMRNAGYQLISIERVDPDTIFNDINHWVATSSYRFFWNTPKDIQKEISEKENVANPDISDATIQNLQDFLLTNINQNVNEKIRALYSQLIKEEQLTNLEQNIVKSISSELNIKLGVLSNTLRSYIEEQMSLHTKEQPSTQQIHTPVDDTSVMSIKIPDPPSQIDNSLPEMEDAPGSNKVSVSSDEEIPSQEVPSQEDNEFTDVVSDAASIFSRKTTPISEVEYEQKETNPTPAPTIIQDIYEPEEVIEPEKDVPIQVQISPVSVDLSNNEESMFDHDFTANLGIDLTSSESSSPNTSFDAGEIEDSFFKQVPIGQPATPAKDFVEEDFGTTKQGILYPELDDPTNFNEVSTEEQKKADDSSVIVDDPDM